MSVQMIPCPMPIGVRFLGKGGWPGERKLALEQLEVGKVYVMLRLDVGRSNSTVDIADGGGMRPLGSYNTAMFEFLSWGFADDVAAESAS